MTTPHPLRRWRSFAALVVGLFCSHPAFAQEAPDAPRAASVVDFSEADANAGAPSGQPVGDGFTEGAVVVTPGQMEEALGELVREYQRTGRAGVLRQSTVMVVPFGHSQPVLACAPLRASVVELQPGEVVLGVVAGDTERFAVGQTHTGPGGRTPLVVVRPLAYDVTTNLVVSTDRRVYHVTLDSAPRPSRARGGDPVNPQPRYARHIRFYYPDDVAADLQPGAARLAPALGPAGVLDADAPASLDDLHFDYQVTGDPDLVDAVERVFDDGVHAYVKLSRQAVRGGGVPVLYAIGPGGDREVLNYAYQPTRDGSGYYVTDRAVREAELVLGATVRTGFLGLGGRRQVERTARLLRLD